MNTEIIAILDRSGSMSSLVKDTIGGYNQFIADQKKEPGEARLTTVIFDDRYEVLEAGVPLNQAKTLTEQTFTARGMTALLDAIGRTLTEQGERITKQKWADLVIVLITTDGGENSSREYTQARIKEMISHAEKHKWKFIFSAANQDAFATGATLGVSAAYTANYAATPKGTRNMYNSFTSTVMLS